MLIERLQSLFIPRRDSADANTDWLGGDAWVSFSHSTSETHAYCPGQRTNDPGCDWVPV